MKCFYHSADLDGHCSGAIVKLANPDCEMIGMDYGEPFPWASVYPEEIVILIDFSLQPFSDMLRLNRLSELVWIDHHKSAIDEAQGTEVRGILDSDYAACELAWRHFFPNDRMPTAVHLLGRYDIWKHKETPGSLEFQYGMRLEADTWPDSALWKTLLVSPGSDSFPSLNAEARTAQITQAGALCLAYEKVQNEKFMSAYGFECEFDGLKCIAANKGMGNSLTFESVYDPSKHDAMCMFAYKNGKWTVSLYSTKPEIDVSAVCKARGGGGHKGAAGFQCKELPFIGKQEGASN